MRNRIWAELTQTKHDIEFIGLYSERQRAILRWFNMGVLIFSTGGVLGWGIWEKLPVVVCIIISAVSLLRLIQPHLIITDKMLNDLNKINVFYIDKFNKLEKLWLDYESSRIEDSQASEIFYKLLESNKEYFPLIDENIRSKPKHIVKKAKENSDCYFIQVFNNSSNE